MASRLATDVTHTFEFKLIIYDAAYATRTFEFKPIIYDATSDRGGRHLLHKTTREESETYGDPPKEIASHDKVYNEQKVLK